MKQYKGVPGLLANPIIGVVTRNSLSFKRKGRILASKDLPAVTFGFEGVVTTTYARKGSLPTIQVDNDTYDSLMEGDCIIISQDGTISVVWDKNSPMNPLLLTEACDCRCLMCPQPPKVHDKDLTKISRRILELVKSNAGQTICLTGGEPTLLKEDIFDILELIVWKHPKAPVMLLTNGKSFADYEFTKRFVSVRPKNLLVCVSLHCDVDEIHDHIVGVKGSFYKTAMGLQNLARFRERIEIRVVVNKLNVGRLESIAVFITRNFPFINHCTFMGMEITGCARENYDKVWIDPHEYRSELAKAIRVISRADLNVSIYNLPLCLVEPSVWNFSKKSISGWKNEYLSVCDACLAKPECCGIFTTSGDYQSPHIAPILNINNLQH